ncbi:MAG: ribonuclease H-like domain-containing protein [Desulfobacterales bacterium]|nr:ribonuclease H-like domain-containing protein [Desulfobacterales bacterium]
MDLKDRLNRLTSLAKPEQESKSQVLSDLRQRLDRLLEPKRIYRKKWIVPIEGLVKGEVVSTPDGETFRAKETFPSDFRYGEMTLSDILNIPTYPAHLLSRNEQLKELDLKKTLFLDTETTGLTGGTGTIAFLIGVGFFQGEEFQVHQFFMRDYSEEKAALSIFKQLLESFQFLITFNGRHYDIPLLETRFILSRTASKIREMPNFDLLFPSRKIWKGAYENCRLVTLESRLLGMERVDDIPSEFIPTLYFDYLRTGDGQKIHRVFYHNQMDILSMVALTGRIHLVYHDPNAAQPRKGVEHFALGRLFWDHGDFGKAVPCFETAMNRCDEDLAWDVMKWLSMAFKKTGESEKARSVWEEMATWPHQKDVFPYVELAKYYEHRLKDFEGAIVYVKKGLDQTPMHREKEIELLQHRKRRLELKKDGL